MLAWGLAGLGVGVGGRGVAVGPIGVAVGGIGVTVLMGVAVLVGVTIMVGVLVGFGAASTGEADVAINAITKHNPIRINKIGMVRFMLRHSPCDPTNL